MRVEIFDDTNRKRPAPSEPTDGLDQAKRQRLGADLPNQLISPLSAPPFPPGPVSYAQLFTLTTDKGSSSFDVQAIPVDTVIKVLVPMLSSMDKGRLDNAINVRDIALNDKTCAFRNLRRHLIYLAARSSRVCGVVLHPNFT